MADRVACIFIAKNRVNEECFGNMILQSDKACEAEVVNHQDNTSGSICEIHIYLGFKSSLLLEQKLTGNSYIL
jgi:hypothetical protein